MSNLVDHIAWIPAFAGMTWLGAAENEGLHQPPRLCISKTEMRTERRTQKDEYTLPNRAIAGDSGCSDVCDVGRRHSLPTDSDGPAEVPDHHLRRPMITNVGWTGRVRLRRPQLLRSLHRQAKVISQQTLLRVKCCTFSVGRSRLIEDSAATVTQAANGLGKLGRIHHSTRNDHELSRPQPGFLSTVRKGRGFSPADHAEFRSLCLAPGAARR